MPINETHCYSCQQDFTYLEYERHRINCDHCEESYCSNEFDETYCPDCGNEFVGAGLCDCEDCRYRRMEDSELPYNGIYHYNYVPPLVFHGNGDYHLGMELEISAHDSALPVYDWASNNGVAGLFYVKEDSSVDGFEIVTHPMTPDYFESVDWNGFFDMINTTYPLGSTRNGSRRRQEREGHGLHVHVSRTAFPTMTGLARWSYLLNRAGREHMTRIARRTSRQWAAFSDTPVRDVMTNCPPTYWRWANYTAHNFDYVMVRCECGCNREYTNQIFIQPQRVAAHRMRTQSNPRRYDAVNLQNTATAEVRIFRSTRSPDEFRDCVRTMYASVEYVRTMQPHHMTTRATSEMLSWQGFAEYVATEYAALYPTVAGMEIEQPEPSMMSEALAADTAITEGTFDPEQATHDERVRILRAEVPNDLDFVPYAEPSGTFTVSSEFFEPANDSRNQQCDVPGCVIRHRISTSIENRVHRNAMGYSIPDPQMGLNVLRDTWDQYVLDLANPL